MSNIESLKIFDGLMRKILAWQQNLKSLPAGAAEHSKLFINGLDHWKLAFALSNWTKQKEFFETSQHIVILSDDLRFLEELYELFLELGAKHSDFPEVDFFPGLELSPYSSLLQSESDCIERWSTLFHLSNESNKKRIILTSLEAASLLNPPRKFFQENSLNLEVSDVVHPDELAGKLIKLGYSHNITVEEPGQFSKKGEIFDLYPLNANPVRLHYFDDMIEEIFEIDPESNRTIRDRKIEKLIISPFLKALTQKEFIINFRENIPQPKPGQTEKFAKRKQIFSQLQEGNLFEEFSGLTHLFFKENETLFDYLGDSPHYFHLNALTAKDNFEHLLDQLREEFEEKETDTQNQNLSPELSKFYQYDEEELLKLPLVSVNDLKIHNDFDHLDFQEVDLALELPKNILNSLVDTSLHGRERSREILKTLSEKVNLTIVICLSNEFGKRDILSILEELEIPLKDHIHFSDFPINRGFYYENENLFVLKDNDILSTVSKRDKSSKKSANLDLFAEQLATLKAGDYVIHNHHGLGVYQGLDSIEMNGQKNDFVIIEYLDGDKIYLPIYKLDQIQKHADSTAGLKPENLKKNKFNQAKAKARESAKKLAFDLLRLQAERKSHKAHSFTPPDENFAEFEKSFPYRETPDQMESIDSILKHMQKETAMDFLVCGDVGFGKTEVAMRAAFKAVLDKKQVAVLVPTTILALQHYNTFVKRFKDFPVEIEFISRFKKTKEVNEIHEKVESGKVDILIGTHSILNKKVKFKDLGLVVVDEEHRFGVNHKEKLKVLKSTVDFLTLTATPIPRTLQLAFLGLRELSLIRTPPAKRQPVKTYLIKEDEATIQKAIRAELSRGGQVYIVHNRVQDIEIFVSKIRDLVPEASIVFAHGQLPEKELEKRISDFYSGKFQILIATTIIESGIDIPNANTMIIDRADRFGLAQLHQLRGRIGRSERKAYAYFMIPHNTPLNDQAMNRLKALQTYTDMGSGFNLATCDLEIRGAGDILGAEQSGHIGNIGLELYLQLLKEAIAELKGEKTEINKNIEVSTPFIAHIPTGYISDSAERLKVYKKLSNFNDLEYINNFEAELEDIYGQIPEELSNLVNILRTRILFSDLPIKSVSVTGPNLLLKFDEEKLNDDPERRNKIVEFFLGHKKQYQFSPDYSVTHTPKTSITPETLFETCQKMKEQMLSL